LGAGGRATGGRGPALGLPLYVSSPSARARKSSIPRAAPPWRAFRS